MTSLIPLVLAAVLSALPDDGIHDIRALVDAIEAAQKPIEDFRCEFEGSATFKGAGAEENKKLVDENGLFDVFAGAFVWKQGGESFTDALHRRSGFDNISNERIMIRPRENMFEHHNHPGGRSVDNVDFRKLDDPGIALSGYDNPSSLFLTDSLKVIRDRDFYATTIADEDVDGRPLKVLTVFIVFKNSDLPNQLLSRYWIDLHRNGHVVRHESYLSDGEMMGRADVTLKSFKIGGEDVWMPVASEAKTYSERDARGLPVATSEPTGLRTLSIIDETLKFNTHPGPEVFTNRYNPAPVSEHLRKLRREFGAEKKAKRAQPTEAEASAAIQALLADAEAENRGLVAGPPSGGFNWWLLSVAGLGATVLASLTLLWMQRRGG